MTLDSVTPPKNQARLTDYGAVGTGSPFLLAWTQLPWWTEPKDAGGTTSYTPLPDARLVPYGVTDIMGMNI